MHGSLDDIAAFVEVVTCGSFRGAARSLGISPSAVSKRVSALEQRLEVQLLHRTTRRLQLTHAGERLYERLRHIPGSVDEALEQVRDETGRATGTLRVVMPTYFENPTLHEQLVPAFLRAHPDVALTLTMVPNPVEHVDRSFDLLVAGRLPHRRFPDSSVIGRRLLKLPGGLYATPEYLTRHGAPAHPRELAGHNCLGYLNPEWHFVQPDGQPFVFQARGNLRTSSNQALHAATLAGLGIAYSFPSFFDEDRAAGRVRQVLADYTDGAYVDIHVFYPGARFLPLRTRAFIDALLAHFAGIAGDEAQGGG